MFHAHEVLIKERQASRELNLREYGRSGDSFEIQQQSHVWSALAGLKNLK
jgi:hypothetical protein